MGTGSLSICYNSMLTITTVREGQDDEEASGNGVSNSTTSDSRAGVKRKQAGGGSAAGGWEGPPTHSAKGVAIPNRNAVGCLGAFPRFESGSLAPWWLSYFPSIREWFLGLLVSSGPSLGSRVVSLSLPLARIQLFL